MRKYSQFHKATPDEVIQKHHCTYICTMTAFVEHLMALITLIVVGVPIFGLYGIYSIQPHFQLIGIARCGPVLGRFLEDNICVGKLERKKKNARNPE